MKRIAAGALRLLVMLAAVAGHRAQAADCPSKDTLGTARVMPVSAQQTPRIGLKHFPQTLPLADKEVVLTFDDGPFAPTTRRVLDALGAQCVRATFFLIGRNAAASPDLVRRIAAEGHTVAYHSWSHPVMSRIGDGAARADIERGIAAVDAALNDRRLTENAPRFFRFPGFASTAPLLDLLQNRNIVVFGADLWVSDWNPMTPEQQLQQAIERLKQARKGVILLHDIHARTAAMLPAFLRYLKLNGYQVVHAVPADGGAVRPPADAPKANESAPAPPPRREISPGRARTD